MTSVDPWGNFLSSLDLNDVGASGLLALVIIMILLGRLVPRSVSDSWRDAYFKEKEAGQIKDQQITKLSDAARVSARALDALPKTGGEPDVATTEESARRKEG